MPARSRRATILHIRARGFRDTERQLSFPRVWLVNPESKASPLSLEEIGLFNLLNRIHADRGAVDHFLRFNLLQRGMVLDEEPLRLSARGLLELQRLAGQVPARGVDA